MVQNIISEESGKGGDWDRYLKLPAGNKHSPHTAHTQMGWRIQYFERRMCMKSRQRSARVSLQHAFCETNFVSTLPATKYRHRIRKYIDFMHFAKFQLISLLLSSRSSSSTSLKSRLRADLCAGYVRYGQPFYKIFIAKRKVREPFRSFILTSILCVGKIRFIFINLHRSTNEWRDRARPRESARVKSKRVQGLVLGASVNDDDDDADGGDQEQWRNTDSPNRWKMSCDVRGSSGGISTVDRMESDQSRRFLKRTTHSHNHSLQHKSKHSFSFFSIFSPPNTNEWMGNGGERHVLVHIIWKEEQNTTRF